MQARLIGLVALLTAAPAWTQELAATSPATTSTGPTSTATSQLVLSRTQRHLPFTGDPIWNLQLQTPGSEHRNFETVTGRAHRQQADRHRAGTRAPLPPGTYRLGPVETLGPNDPAELGPIWIALEPQFPTGRGHLGIHLDPSANRNANSGTLGCVGLIHRQGMEELASLVKTRKVRTLVVLE